jgi:DNA invertase Pin-like site-specific DNA recombinase
MHKIAYSYVRFSRYEQVRGDSLRRQVQLTEDYCRRKGLVLDTSLTLRDLGVSAYRGANAATGALSGFLDAVRAGRVTKGATLVLENLDRLTRDEMGNALTLFIGILNAGVGIVTLSPETEYTKATINDMPTIMQAILQLCLGHEESRKKGERLAAAWSQKRKTIGQRKLTSKGPSWLRLSEDKTCWEVIPEVAAAVRRIYEMSLDGYGCGKIARTLNREGVRGLTDCPWQQRSVGLLLRNRAVLGEFQPHRGNPGGRTPAGEVIKDYYPAILDSDTFWRVQQGLSSRKGMLGPTGDGVANLFTGIIFDAKDGKSLHLSRKGRGDGPALRLVSSGALRGLKDSVYISFPYPVFERVVLDLLRELEVGDLVPPGEAGQPPAAVSVEANKARLKDIQTKIKATQARLVAQPDTEALLTALVALDEERKAAAKDLEAAQEKAASLPAAQALKEYQNVLDLLAKAKPGEELTALRVRLKAAIRRLVSGVWVLMVRRGRDRVCAVQLRFHDRPQCRNYIIYYKTPRRGQVGGEKSPAQWWAKSLSAVAAPGELDLRKSKDAVKLEAALIDLDLESRHEVE